jgi:hypothetical protein
MAAGHVWQIPAAGRSRTANPSLTIEYAPAFQNRPMVRTAGTLDCPRSINAR